MPKSIAAAQPPRLLLMPLRPSLFLALFSAPLLSAPLLAQESRSVPPQERKEEQSPEQLPLPTFKLLRQDEDWSVLRQPGQVEPGESAWLQDWKYHPLEDQGEVWLGIGGEARVRAEAWSDFAFDAAPPGTKDDDGYILERLLLHADLHVGKGLRFFVQGKHASTLEDRELPGGNRSVDVDNLSLAQAFLDVSLGAGEQHTLRVGRQWLALGGQRLVSPRGWGNAQRSFDGVRGIFQLEDWKVSAFFTAYAPEQKHDFNDGDLDEQLGGIYAERRLEGGGQLDLYALYSTHDRRTYNGTTGDDQRLTLGGRRLVRHGDFDAEAEAALQVGEVGSNSVLASMFALQGGWTAPGIECKPRLHLGLDHASGDRKAGGKVQTFDQLYPLGHAYLGTMDYIGRQNIFDLHTGIGIEPRVGSTVRADLHGFWLHDNDDALYNIGGAALRPATAGGSRQVGYEFDLNLRHQFSANVIAEAGYGHFFGGKALRDGGASGDADFVYASMQVLF